MSGNQHRKRILLGQLASNGDCLYATAIARQIKADYPGCHLTWAIGSAYRSILNGNPDVDEVWEIPYYTTPGNFDQWQCFETEARSRQKRGDFDEIFLTQISLNTFHFWVGSVRSGLFRSYPRPITVDVTPVLRLLTEEVDKVRVFAEEHRLSQKSAVILFECAPRSFQSPVTPEFALDVANKIIGGHPDVAVILSSNHSFSAPHENIIDGSVLTLRENAELTKSCSLLIGASSGVTWIATSDWAKPLPMLQLVAPDLARSNSLVYDFQKRGADTSNVIEMSSYSSEDVVACVKELLRDFAVAKAKFHQVTPLKFEHYRHVLSFLLPHRRWKQCFHFFQLNVKEYGLHLQFVLLPLLLLVHFALKMLRKVTIKLRGFVSRH